MLNGFNCLFGLMIVALFIFVGLVQLVQANSDRINNFTKKAFSLLGILSIILGLFMGALLFLVYGIGVIL